MTKTIRALIERADANSGHVLKLLDAKFASIKTPAARLRPTSLKSAITIAFAENGDPLKQIKELRQTSSAQLDAAQDDLANAEKRALSLLALADYLDSGGAFQTDLPSEYQAPTLALKSARTAGHDIAPSIGRELKQVAAAAYHDIEHIAKAVLPRRVAAWRVGHAKNCVKLFKRLAKEFPERAYGTAVKRHEITLRRAEARYDAVRKSIKAREARA